MWLWVGGVRALTRLHRERVGEEFWNCPVGAPWGQPALGRVQQHPTESLGRRDPAPETGKQSRIGLCSLGLALIWGKKNPFSHSPEGAGGFAFQLSLTDVGPGAIPNHPRAGWLYLLHVQAGAFPHQNEWCGLLLGSALAPGSLPEAESGFYGSSGQGCGV